MSVGGNDANDGSIVAPVRTLERAVELAQSLRSADRKATVNVFLRGGVYPINDSIDLDSVNSDGAAPLTIRAYRNEKVRLTGGVDIPLSAMTAAGSDFTEKIIDNSVAGHILQYDLKSSGITGYGEISRRGFLVSANQTAQAELSLDGETQKLAAWPNEDFVGLTQITEPGTRTSDGITNGCSFKVGFDRPAYWSEPEIAWVSGVLGPNYTYDYYPMESFDAATKTVHLREGAAPGYHYSKQFFRFENIPEELDAPGEYYIDRESGMLYYYPAETASEDSVLTVTMLNADLISINGSDGITFENLTFDSGRASAVSGDNTNGIVFKNCDIYGFGENGIRLGAAQNTRVDSCRIHDVGRNGVMITGGDYMSLTGGGNVIYNNDIYNFARLERSYYAGVYLGYRSVGTQVKRNHIHSGPHAGIILYGARHAIEGNEIDNVVLDFHDMNAIYANISAYPWERGNIIRRNYFHDIGNRVFNGEKQINVSAIRTDNTGSGLNVTENLFYNLGYVDSNSVCGVVAQGSRNKVNNNLFLDCSGTYLGNTGAYDPTLVYNDTDTINGVTVASLRSSMTKLLPVFGRYFPELYSFFDEHPRAVATNEFKGNMIINIASPLSNYNRDLNAEQGFRGTRELVQAENNYVSTADPGFMDYAGGDFSLTDGAVSLISGFPKLNMSDFGLVR